jgi:hypothetical protein
VAIEEARTGGYARERDSLSIRVPQQQVNVPRCIFSGSPWRRSRISQPQ